MTTHIGLLLYPDMTQLDLTGPFEVFSHLPDTQVHLVWKNLEPVAADTGMSILPTTTFTDCPPLDVICVPGGHGQVPLMRDPEVLGFLREQGNRARFVTSVCSGSLLLGAAGLMQGYSATSHWAYIDFLPMFGAIPAEGRIVQDRNRITGGGVTAGIDFALTIAAELAGPEIAKRIQLLIEYNPAPPFNSGHPSVADPKLVESVKASLEEIRRKRAAAIRTAQAEASAAA